jgi:hypothetical protein
MRLVPLDFVQTMLAGWCGLRIPTLFIEEPN